MKEMNDKAPNEPVILKSIDRAIDVLEFLLTQEDEVSVSRISKELGFGKSTVYRTLTTLENRGYVAQNPETERYFLGQRVFVYGMRKKHSFVSSIMPYLQRLNDKYLDAERSLASPMQNTPPAVLPQRRPSTTSGSPFRLMRWIPSLKISSRAEPKAVPIRPAIPEATIPPRIPVPETAGSLRTPPEATRAVFRIRMTAGKIPSRISSPHSSLPSGGAQAATPMDIYIFSFLWRGRHANAGFVFCHFPKISESFS